MYIYWLSELYHLDIVYGIVTIILGVLVIENPKIIGSIIPFVVGIGILINSDSFRNRDGVLSLLNDKIEREESVIIYTDKPNHYLKLVR